MGAKSKLYKLAVWYIGKCNKKWNKPTKGLETLDTLTFVSDNKAYLKYGMDAEWKNFSRYEVLDNAIQKLSEYEKQSIKNLFTKSKFDEVKKVEKCSYCEVDVDARDYLIGNGSEGIYISGNGELVADDELEMEDTKINFCPMCGRRFS